MALHPREAACDCRIGGVFKALADPTRLSVIERLSKGPASMTELAQSYQMTLLGKQRAIWEQRLDRLESHVEGMKKEGESL
jgi:DNA-binding transcriptional ArsR family regulator